MDVCYQRGFQNTYSNEVPDCSERELKKAGAFKRS